MCDASSWGDPPSCLIGLCQSNLSSAFGNRVLLGTCSATGHWDDETAAHPTFGTVVTNKNPLSFSLSKIENPCAVRRNNIDDARIVSWVLSNVEHVICCDVYYHQLSSCA